MLSSARRPTRLILVCESQAYPTPIPKTAKPEDVILYEWNQVAAYKNVAEAAQAQITGSMNDPTLCPVAFGRHSGASNYGFADGHIQWMRWEQTWEPAGGAGGANLWNGCGAPAS